MLSSVRRRVAKEETENRSSQDEETKEHNKAQNRWWQIRRLSNRWKTYQIIKILLGLLLVYRWILYPLSVLLVGDGYTSEGGTLGRMADAGFDFFHRRRQQEHPARPIEFPQVILRSNRKKIPGYSRYLEQVLQSHPSQDENDKVTWPRREMSNADSSSFQGPIVKIVEQDDNQKTRRKRIGILEQAQEKRCRPGWFCHRCLGSALFGSFNNCRAVCPSCYEDLLCRNSQQKTDSVSTLKAMTNNAMTSRLIPRIVHQAWKEPLDPLQYPELVRIQHAWRHSGYHYRFYTPDLALEFVKHHYPPRIWHIYNSIRSFDIKLSLFRLLVLFIEGGIFANVDLMLETNLDALLTPNLSFVVARDDGPGDHCLWDGFVAASPGHPFVAQAIEFLIQNLCGGVEGTLCRVQGPAAPLWPVRAFPLEHSFGSCALGMAVHKALGHNDLMTDFQPGLLSSHIDKRKDTLILMMSQDDTGAFRCTDIGRNLLVASTGMMGLTTQSMSERYGQSSLRTSGSNDIPSKQQGVCDLIKFEIVDIE